MNVWLATIVQRHPHHQAAVAWWKNWALPNEARIAFCRLTQLSFLRLLTNQKVMGDQKRTLERAFADYSALLGHRSVVYVQEPSGLDSLLQAHCRLAVSSRNFWTDSYLAAFARAGDYQLATFDQGFKRFPELSLQLLGGMEN